MRKVTKVHLLTAHWGDPTDPGYRVLGIYSTQERALAAWHVKGKTYGAKTGISLQEFNLDDEEAPNTLSYIE